MLLPAGFVATPFFVPTLLVLSAFKFAIVVMFYMHLKYDHKLFRALFTGPLILAMLTIYCVAVPLWQAGDPDRPLDLISQGVAARW